MKYENTIKVLNDYGENTQIEMKNVLIQNKKRASGNLINSIEYELFKQKGIYQIVINFPRYGQFVAGRNRDLEPGHPPKWDKSGPPIKEIKKWLFAKNIPFKKELYRGKKRPNRQKQVDIMAYLIIRKIKQRKRLSPDFNNPTDFLKPFDRMIASSRYKTDIKQALIMDALNYLKKK